MTRGRRWKKSGKKMRNYGRKGIVCSKDWLEDESDKHPLSHQFVTKYLTRPTQDGRHKIPGEIIFKIDAHLASVFMIKDLVL